MGIQLPIGLLASIFGRLARGPRLRGTLDDRRPGGSVLTVELLGGPELRSWSVEGTDLHAMVAELACRVFNDLSLGGSVRWRASRAFTEYLELASEGRSRDRATTLKRAERKLLDAVAEDERFHLAFYNLGIVWSLLADTERAAAEVSEYTKPTDRPLEAYYGRLEAARAAFERSSALDRERPEPVYALAVHRFTRTEDLDAHGLLEIVKHCKRVIELAPGHVQAHDLKGMAQLGLGQAAAAEASHETAVELAARRLHRAEFAKHAAAPGAQDPVPGARANLAAAMRNLADVNRVRAGWERSGRARLKRADRLYARACELAEGDTKAATLRAYGELLEGRDAVRARDAYAAALRIDAENPACSARLAGAFAAGSQWQPAAARSIALEALDRLAPVYRRTLRPHHAAATVMMRDSTLNALERAYARLDDGHGVARITAIRGLRAEILAAADHAALRDLKARFGEGREWEREQVQLALALVLSQDGLWEEAEAEYSDLVALLERHRPAGIVQHDVHAGHARALRKLGRREEALEAAATGALRNPLSAPARRELGKSHFALSQFEEALGAWEPALTLEPNDAHLHWKVAFCHWSIARDGRDEAGRRASLAVAADGFEQAAALFDVPDLEGWAWSRLWAGRALGELGRHDDALRHLRAAAGLEPTAAAAALLLGELDREIGERRLGRARLEEASAAVAGRHDRVLDAGWGDTLTGHEVAVRAAVGLGLVEDDAAVARARAAEARSLTAGIADPLLQARCEAAIAPLEPRPAAVLKRAA